MLQVGMVQGDSFDPADVSSVHKLRSKLNPEADFVLTALDTGFRATTHSSRAHILAFYEWIVKLSEANRNWACLVKPKAGLGKLEFPAELKMVIADLEFESRWVEVDWTECISVAARASDLVVCSSINTAGFTATILGCRVLHLDLAGLATHPIIIDGGLGKLVFDSVESFSAAIERLAMPS